MGIQKNGNRPPARRLNRSLPISKPDRISEDVAKLSGLAARLIQPRDKACKCAIKKDCKAENHKLNDHCSNHCEYDTLKEDSDKLYSIIIAIAGNRLPMSMIETVGAQVRQAEKHQNRTHTEDLRSNASRAH